MINDQWQSSFQILSPGFNIFSWLPTDLVESSYWPMLTHYNELESPSGKVQNQQDIPIEFVDPHIQSKYSYESLIYLKGQVKTRTSNWHDFFNMLIWHTFPLIKSTLNAYHFQQQSRKHHSLTSRRTALENFLTLFDENGVLVISSDDTLLEFIRTMSWKELFWEKRFELSGKLAIFIVGHSLCEKLLNPYVGLVGHSILLQVEKNFFSQNSYDQIKQVDFNIAKWLSDVAKIATPRILYPLPVLGFPGWYPANSIESFFDDNHYFRSTRRSK